MTICNIPDRLSTRGHLHKWGGPPGPRPTPPSACSHVDEPTLPFEAGVTLIEMLVAVTLVALIATGMTLVLRIALDGSAKAQQRIASNRKVMGVERIMREQVANLVPVNTSCQTTAVASTAASEILFQGRPGQMRFVSTYTLNEAARGIPRLVEYVVIPGDRLGFRLVMNELVYGGPRWLVPVCVGYENINDVQVPQFAPIRVSGSSFVLADELASCRFTYRDDHDPQKGPQWVQVWATRQWPAAIRIELVPLVPNPSLLQTSSLTVPVIVNPKPDQEYHE
jgi:prepilin-type N-terminal cleavage/methylation domain-containing protein